MLSLVRRLPVLVGKNGLSGRGVDQRCAPREEVVQQHRAEIDLPHASLGLRVFDIDVPVREVHIADVDPTQLRVPQP
jgi:hypothetical protein